MTPHAQRSGLRRALATAHTLIAGATLRTMLRNDRAQRDVQLVPRVESTICLEIGSGRSPYTMALKSFLGPGKVLAAFDPTKEHLDILAVKLLKVPGAKMKYLAATSDGLPLPDASVDSVFFGYSLERIEDRLFVVREAQRVLRPGGTLVVFLWRPSMTSARRHPVLCYLNRHMMKDYEIYDTYSIRLRYRRAPIADEVSNHDSSHGST